MLVGHDSDWLLAKLRQSDAPMQQIVWGNLCMHPYRYPPSRSLVEHALGEMTRWSEEPTALVDRRLRFALGGIRVMLGDFIKRMPQFERRIAEHLAPLCVARNFDVSVHAMLFFEKHDAFGELAVPSLRRIACGEARSRGDLDDALRALAYKTLVDLTPDAIGDLEVAKGIAVSHYFRQALEFADSKMIYEESCFIANRLIWS